MAAILKPWQLMSVAAWSLACLAGLCLSTLLADDYAPGYPFEPENSPAAVAPVSATRPAILENPPAAPSESFFEPAKIIAVVGDEHILAGDVLPTVNQMLEPYQGKAPPAELDKQRLLLVKRLLVNAIETKIAYLDFLRLVPPDKVPEIHKKVHAQFDSERMPELMEKAQVASAVELDARLRKFGSSLAKSRRMYTEQLLGHSMIGRNIKQNPEVSHEEMLVYYREHAAQYELPAKARWEELSVETSKFPSRENASSRQQAYAAVAALGNEVLRGARFDAVAKRGSHGFTAEQGGYHDWTTRGSLVSKVVDEAVFSLPEGKLSQILEDERGFYILRVIERREAGRVPFVEAQVEIKKEIIKQKQDKDRLAFLDRLRKRTPVSTIFDEPGAPLYSPQAAAE